VAPGAAVAEVSTWEAEGPLQLAATSQLQCVKLYTADVFGNLCVSGGALVQARLTAHHKSSRVNELAKKFESLGGQAGLGSQAPVLVVDNLDGSYSASFRAPSAGEWRLGLLCNGVEVPLPIEFTVRPQASPLPALAVVQRALPQTATVGVSAALELVLTSHLALNDDSNPKELQELAVVVLRPPSGIKRSISIGWVRGQLYEARVLFMEAGDNVVEVLMAGQPVEGSPFKVVVSPEEIYLAYSTVHAFDRNHKCKIGERQRFVVKCKDRLGNGVTRGGLGLTARGTFTRGEKSIQCQVEDLGDGSYAITYTPVFTGPFSISLAAVRSNSGLSVEGECVPGDEDVTQCVVDTDRLARWVAGRPSHIVCTRHDAHGHPVTATQPLTQYQVQASGPGTVQSEVVEVGGGTFHVVLTGTLAGTYTIILFKGKLQVQGFPLTAELQPSVPSASSCVSFLKGVAHGNGSEVTAFKSLYKCDEGSSLKPQHPECLQLRQVPQGGRTWQRIRGDWIIPVFVLV
jgi:hypothetical protein